MSTPTRSPRADALRNRERVLQAAREVFAAHGLGAGVPEIAARAGVGKGTVYRSFPTKEHLICAIACEAMEWFTARAQAAAAEPDPWAAFVALLEECAQRQSGDRTVSAALAHVSTLDALTSVQSAAQSALEMLMDRAKAAGAMRADAQAREVRLLLTGASTALAAADEDDPAAWRRAARLVADAFRA